MTKIPYVHSNYPRIPDDDYKTIDKRCVYGLLEHFQPAGKCVDVCAMNGSGIVDTLLECGYDAIGIKDAFDKRIDPDWVITNPPYQRGLVDEIIYGQIRRINEGRVNCLAILLRSNFDFAKSRVMMFGKNPYYFGQIKLLFRPWWSEDRKAQPIHNYVWHIWKTYPDTRGRVLYSLGEKPVKKEA